MTSPFAPLPTTEGGFVCVHADVPSRFKSNSEAKPGRNAMRHYGCLPMSVIATFPVRDVVAEDALLWFWTTSPLLTIGAHIPVIKAWGFEPTAIGFTWLKLNRRAAFPLLSERDFFLGGGLTTRKNAEFCILCRRGKPKRLAADVRELIISPVRESGRKPDETYRRIERYCAGPRLDLFARESREGWVSFGDQATLFDSREAA